VVQSARKDLGRRCRSVKELLGLINTLVFSALGSGKTAVLCIEVMPTSFRSA